MEIPDLLEKERQEMFTQMWVGQMYGAISFIMEKIGPQALDEYNEQVAKRAAEQFRAMGKDDPMSFAMAQAITCKQYVKLIDDTFGINIRHYYNYLPKIAINNTDSTTSREAK